MHPVNYITCYFVRVCFCIFSVFLFTGFILFYFLMCLMYVSFNEDYSNVIKTSMQSFVITLANVDRF